MNKKKLRNILLPIVIIARHRGLLCGLFHAHPAPP